MGVGRGSTEARDLFYFLEGSDISNRMEGKMWLVGFPRLSTDEAASLELPFSNAEMGIALKELNGDKAPGPGGFTADSYFLAIQLGGGEGQDRRDLQSSFIQENLWKS